MSELQAVTASPVREIARAVSLPHETVICDSTANPAPLGLMGFGLTTILLNMHNAGFIGIGSMILAMGLFYLVLFVGTFRTTRALMLVFFLVTLLFFLLAVADATGNKAITRLAGYEGILCGLGAMYVGAAQIWNEMYGRAVLPLGSFD